MAPLILSRTCYHSASTYSNLTQELCSSRPVQLDRPSNQQEIDSKALGKILLDADLYGLKHAYCPAASELAGLLMRADRDTELLVMLQIKASVSPGCTWQTRANQPRMRSCATSLRGQRSV